MANTEARASYSRINIKGRSYIKIKRRCGFKVDKDTGVLIPYYKDFYGSTKKEAEAKCSSYRIENCLDENGMPDLNAKKIERRTFRELLEKWLTGVFLRDPEYAQGTKERYVSAYNANLKDDPIMDRFIVTLIGADLEEAYNRMSCGGSTVLACHKLMRLFFSYMAKQGVCSDITIGIKVVKEPKHKRVDQSIETIPEAQLKEILAAFENHRLYLLIVLAIRTGARISELLALQYSDITDEGIRINKQVAYDEEHRLVIAKTKTKKAIRIVPVNEDTRELIKKHRAWQKTEMLKNGYRTDYLFTTSSGKFYDKHNVQTACNRVYDKIGLKHFGFHLYRHTFGSMLANRGVPIQDLAALLGHTDVSTTAKYYINISSEAKIAAINLLCV